MGTTPSVAYIVAIIICIFLFLVAVVISNMIPNQPGGKDIIQRRVWYWILFAATVSVTFGVNYIIGSGIAIPSKHAAYLTASGIGTGIAAAIYLILGICLSKGMKRSKIGSWF